jgi:hypothetical protein
MKRFANALLVVLLLALAAGCSEESVATPTAQTTEKVVTPSVALPSPSGSAVLSIASPSPPATAVRTPLVILEPTQPATTEQLEALEILGKAYAEDAGISLSKVEGGVVAAVAGDPSAWVERLEKALSVGYTPQKGKFHAIWYEQVAGSSALEMAGGRALSDVLRDVLVRGNLVLSVDWYFSAGKPAESYAVFSPGGEPLFDTLLAMPVIDAPVFDSDHF